MAQLCQEMPDGKPRKVWVPEAGYCSDTVYEDKLNKLTEKELQHEHLQQILLVYGYKVIAVPITLWPFFTTTLQSAQTLGVKRVRVNRLMNALHAHAITSLHAIIELRRGLERFPTSSKN